MIGGDARLCVFKGLAGPLAGDIAPCPVCGRWCVLVMEHGALMIREHLMIPVTREQARDDAARERIKERKARAATVLEWFVYNPVTGKVEAAVMAIKKPTYFREPFEVLTEDEMIERHPLALEGYEFYEVRP